MFGRYGSELINKEAKEGKEKPLRKTLEAK